jgi:hypothetical protein
MSPAKALFFSFFAGWRNLVPFLVYGLGWTLFALVIPMLLGLGLGWLLPRQSGSASLVALVIMPYMLAVMCALICSFYSSYVAIFGTAESPAEPPSGQAPPA